MAAEGFKGLIVSFLIIGLFTFALISFGVGFANDNELNTSIINDSRVSVVYGNLSSNLTNAESEAETQKEALEKDKGVIGALDFILDSLKTTRTILSTVLVGIYSLLMGLVSDVLFSGDFSVVTATITAILFIVMALLAWRLLKTGE